MLSLVILFWATWSANAQAVPLGHRLFSKLTWDEVVAIAKDPRQICSRIRNNVTYREEMGEQWQTGKTTWEKGKGDCEDFAEAVVELCKEKGFDAEVYVVFPKGSWEAHAVAVGTFEGQMWLSSNGGYQEVASFAEAQRKVATDMGWRKKQLVFKTALEIDPDYIASMN